MCLGEGSKRHGHGNAGTRQQQELVQAVKGLVKRRAAGAALGAAACAAEVCAGGGSVSAGAAPTFRLEDLHGLKADFALIVAEGDQGWGRDSSLEDGGQGGVLLFAVPRCHRCHLHPGAAARNPSDLTHWVITAGRKQALSCLFAQETSRVSLISPPLPRQAGQAECVKAALGDHGPSRPPSATASLDFSVFGEKQKSTSEESGGLR